MSWYDKLTVVWIISGMATLVITLVYKWFKDET
jgi:hypothetical protein